MARTLTWSLLAAIFLLWSSRTTASAAHRQVFLLGGQSNMVGNGTNSFVPVAQPFSAPLPDVRLYFGSPSTGSPLTANDWISLAPGSGSEFGPELSFGHTLHQTDPRGDYALIKYARGGSNVSADWNPTVENKVYANFRATVDAGLQQLTDEGDTHEIAGMLWTQGIRDGKDGRTASQYQMDLERLIADVRLNYGSDLPFFISRLSINMTGAGVGSTGGRRGEPTGLAGIRLGQENVAANDPRAFLIDTDDFGVGDPSHFNTSGQIALGKAFAASYFQSLSVPEPNSLLIWTMLLAELIRRRRPRGSPKVARRSTTFCRGIDLSNTAIRATRFAEK